jgi:hypothetical protein
MKEVTKERTKVEKYTVYESVDGTEFTCLEECRKYEESARGVAKGKVQSLFVSTGKDAWTLMGGCDDNEVVTVKFKNNTDVDNFLQWLYLECPWYLNDIHKERKVEVESIVHIAAEKNDVILIGRSCDGDYYFINSRQNIVNNLLNLDKEEENEEG